ncbi:MAG: hypothetical protein IT292_03490 [Deltaproteobacteria bacterium]|nr:hypothetical protein [Deltaproteobacteria bacterium]
MKVILYISSSILILALAIVSYDVWQLHSLRSVSRQVAARANSLSCHRLAIEQKYRPTVRGYLSEGIVPFLYRSEVSTLSSVYYAELALNSIDCLLIDAAFPPEKLFAEALSYSTLAARDMPDKEGNYTLIKLKDNIEVTTDLGVGEAIELRYSRPYGYTPLGKALAVTAESPRSYAFNLSPGCYVVEFQAFTRSCDLFDVSVRAGEGNVASQKFDLDIIARGIYKLPFVLTENSRGFVQLTMSPAGEAGRGTQHKKRHRGKKNCFVQMPKAFVHSVAIRRLD